MSKPITFLERVKTYGEPSAWASYAIWLCGGPSAAAARIGLSKPAVSKWQRGVRVAEAQVRPLCAATGWVVKPWQLRPDLWAEGEGLPRHLRQCSTEEQLDLLEGVPA